MAVGHDRVLGRQLVAQAGRQVLVDLCFLREFVRPGGLVVLDDCDWPSVATAVRYFELNTGWQEQPFHRPTRLRAYRLPDPRHEPTFESFTPFAPGGARATLT